MPKNFGKNLVKSFGYGMSDALLSNSAPEFKQLLEKNKLPKNTTGKSKLSKDYIKNLMKDKSSEQKKQISEFFDLGKEGSKNLLEEIKSGNWFGDSNRKDAEEKSINDIIGMDMVDEFMSFDDDDFDFGDDDEYTDSKSYSSGDIDLNLESNQNSYFNDNRTSVNKVYQIRNTKNGVNSDVVSAISNQLVGGMATLSGQLNQNSALSQDYFKQATDYQSQTLEILTEIKDTMTEIYKTEESSYKHNVLDDIFGADGILDVKALTGHLFSGVKDALSEDNMSMYKSMAQTLVADPMKNIMGFVGESLIPKVISDSMEEFNKNIINSTKSLFLQLTDGKNGKGGPLQKLFGKFLGINSYGLNEAESASNYKKTAVPFDGVTKKAITEVIPTYLSKILNEVASIRGHIGAKKSSNDEMLFDYDKGQFFSRKQAKEFKENKFQNQMNYSFGDTNDLVREYYKNKISYSDEEKTKKDSLEKEIEKLKSQLDSLKGDDLSKAKNKIDTNKSLLKELENSKLNPKMKNFNKLNRSLMNYGQLSYNGKIDEQTMLGLINEGYSLDDIAEFQNIFKSKKSIQKLNANRLDYLKELNDEEQSLSGIPTLNNMMNLQSKNYGLTTDEIKKQKNKKAKVNNVEQVKAFLTENAEGLQSENLGRGTKKYSDFLAENEGSRFKHLKAAGNYATQLGSNALNKTNEIFASLLFGSENGKKGLMRNVKDGLTNVLTDENNAIGKLVAKTPLKKKLEDAKKKREEENSKNLSSIANNSQALNEALSGVPEDIAKLVRAGTEEYSISMKDTKLYQILGQMYEGITGKKMNIKDYIKDGEKNPNKLPKLKTEIEELKDKVINKKDLFVKKIKMALLGKNGLKDLDENSGVIDIFRARIKESIFNPIKNKLKEKIADPLKNKLKKGKLKATNYLKSHIQNETFKKFGQNIKDKFNSGKDKLKGIARPFIDNGLANFNGNKDAVARMAILEADRRKLTGKERQRFIKNYVKDKTNNNLVASTKRKIGNVKDIVKNKAGELRSGVSNKIKSVLGEEGSDESAIKLLGKHLKDGITTKVKLDLINPAKEKLFGKKDKDGKSVTEGILTKVGKSFADWMDEHDVFNKLNGVLDVFGAELKYQAKQMFKRITGFFKNAVKNVFGFAKKILLTKLVPLIKRLFSKGKKKAGGSKIGKAVSGFAGGVVDFIGNAKDKLEEKQRARFTDKNGVFDVEAATKAGFGHLDKENWQYKEKQRMKEMKNANNMAFLRGEEAKYDKSEILKIQDKLKDAKKNKGKYDKDGNVIKGWDAAPASQGEIAINDSLDKVNQTIIEKVGGGLTQIISLLQTKHNEDGSKKTEDEIKAEQQSLTGAVKDKLGGEDAIKEAEEKKKNEAEEKQKMGVFDAIKNTALNTAPMRKLSSMFGGIKTVFMLAVTALKGIKTGVTKVLKFFGKSIKFGGKIINNVKGSLFGDRKALTELAEQDADHLMAEGKLQAEDRAAYIANFVHVGQQNSLVGKAKKLISNKILNPAKKKLDKFWNGDNEALMQSIRKDADHRGLEGKERLDYIMTAYHEMKNQTGLKGKIMKKVVNPFKDKVLKNAKRLWGGASPEEVDMLLDGISNYADKNDLDDSRRVSLMMNAVSLMEQGGIKGLAKKGMAKAKNFLKKKTKSLTDGLMKFDEKQAMEIAMEDADKQGLEGEERIQYLLDAVKSAKKANTKKNISTIKKNVKNLFSEDKRQQMLEQFELKKQAFEMKALVARERAKDAASALREKAKDLSSQALEKSKALMEMAGTKKREAFKFVKERGRQFVKNLWDSLSTKASAIAEMVSGGIKAVAKAAQGIPIGGRAVAAGIAAVGMGTVGALIAKSISKASSADPEKPDNFAPKDGKSAMKKADKQKKDGEKKSKEKEKKNKKKKKGILGLAKTAASFTPLGLAARMLKFTTGKIFGKKKDNGLISRDGMRDTLNVKPEIGEERDGKVFTGSKFESKGKLKLGQKFGNMVWNGIKMISLTRMNEDKKSSNWWEKLLFGGTKDDNPNPLANQNDSKSNSSKPKGLFGLIKDVAKNTNGLDKLSDLLSNLINNLGSNLTKSMETVGNALGSSIGSISSSSGDSSSSDSGSSSSSSYGGASVFSGNNNAQIAWNFFRGKGVSEAGTAGILGNLQQESGIDPKKVQYGGGPGRGIAQWTVNSDRYKFVQSIAKKMGKKFTDIEPQLEAIWQELNSKGLQYFFKIKGYTKDQLFNATNPNRAADIFEQVFERAGKPMMKNRYKYANQILKKYKGTQTTVASKGSNDLSGIDVSSLKKTKSSLGKSGSKLSKTIFNASKKADIKSISSGKDIKNIVSKIKDKDKQKQVSKYLTKKLKKSGTDASSSSSSSKASASGWMGSVSKIKQAFASRKPKYYASGGRNFKLKLGGKDAMVRPDCSGLVSSMLQDFSPKYTSGQQSSAFFANPNNAQMKKLGFKPLKWSGWGSLKEGDILASNPSYNKIRNTGSTHHVEVFSHNKNGRHYVYSGGSTDSLRASGVTTSGHSNGYQTVWRLNGSVGSASNSAFNDNSGGGSSNGGGGSSYTPVSLSYTPYGGSTSSATSTGYNTGGTNSSSSGVSSYTKQLKTIIKYLKEIAESDKSIKVDVKKIANKEASSKSSSKKKKEKKKAKEEVIYKNVSNKGTTITKNKNIFTGTLSSHALKIAQGV